MNILIIDNQTKHLEEISKLCAGNQITIKKWSEIAFLDAETFDLIILSGGSGMTISEHETDLANEFTIVRDSAKPIIGICLGFEVICHVFGCKMEYDPEIQKGIIDIKAVSADPIFAGKSDLKVFMAHKWHVKEISSELVELAASEKGIEIIKHRTRPIYGFQFHPEIIDPANDGADLFINCLQIIHAEKIVA